MLTALLLAMMMSNRVQAADIHRAWATAYCLKGTTASGEPVRSGIVASKPEWIGKTMIMWADTGDGLIHPENYIGTYQIRDTGSENIRKGYVVDIWMEKYNDCMQFGSKRIIFQVIESEG